MMYEARELPPWRVGGFVHRRALQAGARRAVTYLQDFDQRTLVPLDDESGDPVGRVLPVFGTDEGEAFSTVAPVQRVQPGATSLALPLVDGGERVGVLAVEIAGRPADVGAWEEFAAQVASLVVSKGAGTDAYFRVRRRKDMSLAAEMQWHLLPPLSLVDPRFSVAGILEPAYQMGGDAFDYAINDDLAHFGVFDAMGHGLAAAIMASVAVGAYRHGRRSGIPLHELYGLMDREFSAQFGQDRFVTAILADVDLTDGTMTMVNAGHPAPLHIRNGRVLATLPGATTVPVGLGGSEPDIVVHHLQPGDRVLFYSDGVTEARRRGNSYGTEALVDDVEKAMALGLPAAEAVRQLNLRLVEWRGGDPEDDATIVLAEFRSPEMPPL